VTKQTKEQKPLAESNLEESHQKFIQDMYLMGRKLTRQEINMAILQAEQIGHI
jgi:hypothetical protein